MITKDAIGATVFYCRTKTPEAYFTKNPQPYSAPSSRRKPEFVSNVILLVREGQAYFTFKNRTILAVKNDVFAWDLTSLALKRIRAVPETSFSYTIMTFNLFSAAGVQISLSNMGFKFEMQAKHPEEVERILDEISSAINGKTRHYLKKCSVLVLDLLEKLENASAMGGAHQKEADRLDPRVEAALYYIENHYKDRISIKFLAEKAGLHPKYFTALFKKQTGVSPHRNILERKIEKAKDFLGLLDEGRLHTGEHLGFHDYSHFYRAFKQVTGMTPTQYIQRFRSRFEWSDEKIWTLVLRTSKRAD